MTIPFFTLGNSSLLFDLEVPESKVGRKELKFEVQFDEINANYLFLPTCLETWRVYFSKFPSIQDVFILPFQIARNFLFLFIKRKSHAIGPVFCAQKRFKSNESDIDGRYTYGQHIILAFSQFFQLFSHTHTRLEELFLPTALSIYRLGKVS